MRIVLNTHADDAAAAACIHGLGRRLGERSIDAAVNDWEDYRRYDVAVFLGYDSDATRARAENPAIRVALADPKQSRPEWIEAARDADFLLVGSVEQRDAFARLNSNQLVFYMFAPMPAAPRSHADRERLVIGYHGNRIHLESMAGRAQVALEELGRRRPVELLAIYDVARLGKAQLGLPDERVVRVRHVQWRENFAAELAEADIGIVPTELPIRNRAEALEATSYRLGELAYEPFDHLVRFKASANPGRLYPFARLGIPVVADFFPSAAQFVVDGESGFLASSAHGWLDALESLAGSAELRTELGLALARRLDDAYERQVDAFLEFCERPPKPRPPALEGVAAAESDLARLDHYARPRGAGRLQALAARALGRR